ncbi:peroxisomal sarcosine oxidase isoform X1 [Carettochelys insculpta]|uniref:peroxisomal sarcosine oxidase isoform X1 n=1 Tax=Carettochelys insculpta TaxID=44489 RepID=UPI003EBE3466
MQALAQGRTGSPPAPHSWPERSWLPWGCWGLGQAGSWLTRACLTVPPASLPGQLPRAEPPHPQRLPPGALRQHGGRELPPVGAAGGRGGNPALQTGLLILGAADDPEFQSCRRSLAQHHIPSQLFTAESLPRHFSGIQPHGGELAVSDLTAGVLYAGRALQAVQDGFRRCGGALCDGQKVTDIKPGPVVTVMTSRGVYQARSVVITAGPWTNKLLAPLGLQLPLQTLRINVCYWQEQVPGTYGIPEHFPCLLAFHANQAPHLIYALPSNEYPGLVKVCYNYGSPADPEERDRLPTASADIQILRDFVSKYLPGLVPEPAVVEQCMYTNTPDEDFVLDRHPKFSNIIIGAGFSGHGFKLAPVVGKLLSQLSAGEEPSYALEPFRIRRFPALEEEEARAAAATCPSASAGRPAA